MKKSRSRRRLTSVVVAGLAVVAVVVGAVVLARSYYDRNLQPVSASQTAVVVTIPSGSSVTQIADTLHQKHLIRNASVFSQYVRSQNVQSKLQAGTYSLQPSLSVEQVVQILTQGNIVKNLFTILPGQRIDQIKSTMINAGFKASDVDDAFTPSLYANYPALADKPAAASLEGYLYPDSYQRVTSTKPETIIGQSLQEMQDHLTTDIRDGFAAQGLSVNSGIILSSMVEKEVAKPADRTQVAQVFLSRLSQGMAMQSDVVTIYGDILAGHAPSTTYDTPYNVYLHTGLPPTPISNVTDSSMSAVAHPATTSWLYFVSGDDGNTYFSTNLQDHQALTKQYCHKLCS
ncbi:MAG: endolytic transglycosylase MltG [Candidatus Saccharimonadales bacterium]